MFSNVPTYYLQGKPLSQEDSLILFKNKHLQNVTGLIQALLDGRAEAANKPPMNTKMAQGAERQQYLLSIMKCVKVYKHY